jgi:hypothetical protein
MWKIHGPTFLDSFLYDQVGTRVTSRALLIFQNGLLALLLLNVMFVPWVFFGWKKSKETVQKLWNQNPTFFIFALFWTLAILGMGALTSKFYERYLLPVAPVIAVWIAWFLVEAKFEIKKQGLKLALGILLGLNFIVLLFSAWINFQMNFEILLWVQFLTGIIIFGYLLRLFVIGEKLPKAISYNLLLLFFFISTATYRISLPDQGQQVKLFAAENQLSSDGKIGFIGNLHTSSKIRIGLGTSYDFVDLPRFTFREVIKDYDRLILEDKYLDSIDHSNFNKRVVATNWSSRYIPDLLLSLGKPEFDSLMQNHGKKYYLLEVK